MTDKRCQFCHRDIADKSEHYATGPDTCPALAAAFDPPLSRSEQSERTWADYRLRYRKSRRVA